MKLPPLKYFLPLQKFYDLKWNSILKETLKVTTFEVWQLLDSLYIYAKKCWWNTHIDMFKEKYNSAHGKISHKHDDKDLLKVLKTPIFIWPTVNSLNHVPMLLSAFVV